ncbi:MAG: response regulator [Fusicatenibacter sp.]
MYQVLIVDDDKLARKGLISLVPWEQCGFTVAGDVANGSLALQFLETHPVDLAVVDLTMPVLSGLDFICECRARGISMEYIVLSAHEDFSYVQKALRLGVLDYLSKMQLEPDECVEIFQRAAEKIQKKKSELSSVSPDASKSEVILTPEEKEGWKEIWEMIPDLGWVYNLEQLELLCRKKQKLPQTHKNNYRLLVHILQTLQRAFEVRFDEHFFETYLEENKWIPLIRDELYRKVKAGDCGQTMEVLILKAVILISQDLTNSQLKAETIADTVGMSRSYFSINFKKHTGYSVNSFIRKERIALAKQLIHENDRISIGEISERVGYHDEKYFAKIFLQNEGITFSEYKKH